MTEDAHGSGQFNQVVLRPTVTVAEAGMRQLAHILHDQVGAKCFIARSVAFPVHHQPTTVIATGRAMQKRRRNAPEQALAHHQAVANGYGSTEQDGWRPVRRLSPAGLARDPQRYKIGTEARSGPSHVVLVSCPLVVPLTNGHDQADQQASRWTLLEEGDVPPSCWRTGRCHRQMG